MHPSSAGGSAAPSLRRTPSSATAREEEDHGEGEGEGKVEGGAPPGGRDMSRYSEIHVTAQSVRLLNPSDL